MVFLIVLYNIGMTKNIIIKLVILVILVAGFGVWYFLNQDTNSEQPAEDKPVACTADAKLCPDGSSVGREGPDCQFAKCPQEPVDEDVSESIDSKADEIVLDNPPAGSYITSPLRITGEARGMWFFEADFTVLLVDWDGRIVAEHYVTADDDWMSEDFVPFSGELEFTSPYQPGDPDFMKRGTLILQKANPSGLPENDDALEIPVYFRAAVE